MLRVLIKVTGFYYAVLHNIVFGLVFIFLSCNYTCMWSFSGEQSQVGFESSTGLNLES